MNQQELLVKVSDWIAQTAQQVGDFAAKEIPPFITEYLTWKFWQNAVPVICHLSALIIPAIAIPLCIKAIKVCWEKKKACSYSDWEIPAILLTILGILGSCAFVATWCSNIPLDNITNCIQIKVAPKVYLVEKAAELYKQTKQ